MLNRTIKLTPQIRKDLVDSIVRAHEKEIPRPQVNALSDPQDLIKLDNWRKAREDYRFRLIAVLATFKTVEQLVELWPQAEKFIPNYVLNPAKHFALPKKAA